MRRNTSGGHTGFVAINSLVFFIALAQGGHGTVESLPSRAVETGPRRAQPGADGDRPDQHKEEPDHVFTPGVTPRWCRSSWHGQPVHSPVPYAPLACDLALGRAVFLTVEPRIQTDLLGVGTCYFLPPMVRPQVPLAIVGPVVPHERPPNRGVHAKGVPILLAQPIEASSTTAIPCEQISVCLQIRKDCLQSTLMSCATRVEIIVVVAFVLLGSGISSGLQLL